MAECTEVGDLLNLDPRALEGCEHSEDASVREAVHQEIERGGRPSSLTGQKADQQIPEWAIDDPPNNRLPLVCWRRPCCPNSWSTPQASNQRDHHGRKAFPACSLQQDHEGNGAGRFGHEAKERS